MAHRNELGHDGQVADRAVQVAIYFEVAGTKFAEVVPRQTQLMIHLNNFDGNKRGMDVQDLQAQGVGWLFGTGAYRFALKSLDHIGPTVELVKQSLETALLAT